MKDYSQRRVEMWVDLLRNSSGKEFQNQAKLLYTDNPSVQGMWHPYVHSEPSLAQATFPNVSEEYCKKTVLLLLSIFFFSLISTKFQKFWIKDPQPLKNY